MFDVKEEYEKFVDTFEKAHDWTGASDNRLVAEEFARKKKRFYKVFTTVFNDAIHEYPYSMINISQGMQCLIDLSDYNLKSLLISDDKLEMTTNHDLYKMIDRSDMTLGQVLALD